jgi:ribosomal protein S18 acetylase RimI-like enzyme
MSDAPDAVRFRRLGAADRAAVARIAGAAFAGNRFYESALGMSPRDLPVYWDALFQLLLTDSRAVVYGLERGSSLIAATALALPGFPSPLRGARFLVALARGLGVHHLVRYLRFVHAYDRAMRQPDGEASREARAYWLFVDPRAARAGAGSRLVRETITALCALGYNLYTAFVDASNDALLAFYRRHGFAVLPALDFFGSRAARIEFRRPEAAPC